MSFIYAAVFVMQRAFAAEQRLKLQEQQQQQDATVGL